MGLLEWIIGSGAVLLGAGIGAWFRFGPGARVGAVADAILGSPPVMDRHGGLIDAGSPGLVQRVSTLEDAIKVMADQDFRLRMLERGHVDHDNRIIKAEVAIASLVAASVERAATAASAAAAMNLIRDEQTLIAEQQPGE